MVGVLLAVACAAGTNLSGLWKQRGAAQTRDVDIRRPLVTAVALFRSKWFAIGWVVALVAWLLHIGALALAPLSLAQAVMAGGLVLLGVFAERFFGFDLDRRQWIGLALASLALAVLAGTGGSQPSHSRYAIVAIATFEGAALALGAAFVAGCRVDRLHRRRGVMLGAAAGLLFGVSDVSIKAVTTGTHGALGIANPWAVIGALAGVAAFYASARSFQIGNAVAVITASAAAANLVGIAGGIIVFGDPLGNDSLTIGGRVTAFALVIVAVSLIPAPTRARAAVAADASDASGASKRPRREPAASTVSS
jgi:drug/metabolite transporter (DMT)-like permease